MKRTYEKKSDQLVNSVKSTTLNLQTRPFAPPQSDASQVSEMTTSDSIQYKGASSENLLEKIISTPTPESLVTPTPIQRKPLNRLAAIRSQHMPIQTKLNIGEPNDKYEKEADDTASKVVQQINSPIQEKSVQRQESMEEEDEELQMKPISKIQRQESMEEEDEELQMKPLVQRRENLGGGEASIDLESSIQSARGGGQSLDSRLQTKMGQAMGADFSGVKVHTDSQSDQLNRSIQAKAFTTGKDIFFKQGQYSPSSPGGQELIAHELTHVVQQNSGELQRSPLPSQSRLPDPTIGTENFSDYARSTVRLQRKFLPAKTTAKTHLRLDKGVGVKPGKKIGANLPPDSPIIVDENQQYTQTHLVGSDTIWTRAVNIRPDQWDPLNSPNTGGYIRQSKVGAKGVYPQDQGGGRMCYWDEQLGEFEKKAESPTTPGIWLVRTSNGLFKKYNVATQTEDVSPYDMAEKVSSGNEFLKVGELNGIWLLRKFVGNQLLKYDPSNGNEDYSPFTNQEKLAMYETSVEKDFNIQQTRDPALSNPRMTDVQEPYAYPLLAGTIVHIKGDPNEEFYDRQLSAVRNALVSLAAKAVPLPNHLEIYISSLSSMQQAAYTMTNRNAIIMKPSMFNNPDQDKTEGESGIRGGTTNNAAFGVPHQVARQEDNLSKEEMEEKIASSAVVHEIGHVKHKLNAPNKFAKNEQVDLGGNWEELRKQVSQYAASTDNPNEFVAEIFAGIVADMRYPQTVIDLYKQLGGAQIWNQEADVIQAKFENDILSKKNSFDNYQTMISPHVQKQVTNYNLIQKQNDATPIGFQTTSLTGTNKDGSISHDFTWQSSTGNLNDLSDVATREKVVFDRPPGQFMPAYDLYVQQDGRSNLNGNVLLKGGPVGSSGGGHDTHSPGYGPFFDNQAGFIKQVGTLNSDQWYQYCDPDTGTWHDIPNSHFTINREITKKGLIFTTWHLKTTKTSIDLGGSASAKTKLYKNQKDYMNSSH